MVTRQLANICLRVPSIVCGGDDGGVCINQDSVVSMRYFPSIWRLMGMARTYTATYSCYESPLPPTKKIGRP
eukprot:scaffold44715_cov35-Prasinocladus_malaysianus.AAC.1